MKVRTLNGELIDSENAIPVYIDFDLLSGELILSNESYIRRDRNPLFTKQYPVNIKIDKNHYVKSILEYLPKNLYKEDINGFYIHVNDFKKFKSEKPLKYRKVKNSITKPCGNLEIDILSGVKSPTYTVTEGKKYTFGVELETISGFLPEELDWYLNYDAVHDGSLRGPDGEDPVGAEYVTGVLTGDTGFLQLKRLSNELTKRCTIDKRCGMHLHIGNFDFSKENIVLLYKVYYSLEMQLFKMLPKSRFNNKYCKKLPHINDCLYHDINDNYNTYIEKAYSSLIKWVSSIEGLPGKNNNKKLEHPLGHKCGYRPDASRYSWLNFVPAIYNTRSNVNAKTLEIRNHSGTTNYTKIKYWILIHMGIINYVENYKREILENENFSLNDIIKKVYPKSFCNIIEYIETRTNLFYPNDVISIPESIEYNETNDDELLTLKTI